MRNERHITCTVLKMYAWDLTVHMCILIHACTIQCLKLHVFCILIMHVHASLVYNYTCMYMYTYLCAFVCLCVLGLVVEKHYKIIFIFDV